MKKKTNKNLIEIVMPFPGLSPEMGQDGLFDDCPLCQQLKKDLESKKVRREIFESSDGSVTGFRSD